MIKHIVCFKLKNINDVDRSVEILKSMEGKVPQIISLEVGKDFLHSERSYDIILQVVVKDEQALNDYQNDAYHCNVVKPHMHSVRSSSVAVDYYL
ncbi:MAG: Dabb family protein [Clostridia bacterium]|nr:Dabb family protein [Clostridia bacterium]